MRRRLQRSGSASPCGPKSFLAAGLKYTGVRTIFR